jgi:hypothetical protein
MFYWATVLATFAMGTAVGDLTAKTLGMGYLASGIWFLFAFAAVAVAHWKFHLNPILAFWVAYVLTRPVGASFADYIAFPHSVGGLGVGHGPVALVLTVFIAILVGYLAVTRKDVEDPRQGQVAASAASARYRHGGQQPGYPPAAQPMPPRAARPDPPPRYAGQRPEERYSGERYQDQRYAGQQHPEERYSGERYQDQRYAGQQHPEERYSGERYQDQRYAGQQYPEERYTEEQYRTQQYPRERHRDERYPGQRYPEERYPEQPRSSPPRPAPREPWPPPERQPPRQSRQPEPWPDEDEAEHTAWGFFMWDQ